MNGRVFDVYQKMLAGGLLEKSTDALHGVYWPHGFDLGKEAGVTQLSEAGGNGQSSRGAYSRNYGKVPASVTHI